jgi:hypothetical protein
MQPQGINYFFPQMQEEFFCGYAAAGYLKYYILIGAPLLSRHKSGAGKRRPQAAGALRLKRRRGLLFLSCIFHMRILFI